MPLEILVFFLQGLVSADDLLAKGLYVRRKKPVETKFRTLLVGESCALVQALPISASAAKAAASSCLT
jgi:hypothetical protein